MLFHLRHVLRLEDKLRKSHKSLWIKAFKAQDVNSEYKENDG